MKITKFNHKRLRKKMNKCKDLIFLFDEYDAPAGSYEKNKDTSVWCYISNKDKIIRETNRITEEVLNINKHTNASHLICLNDEDKDYWTRFYCAGITLTNSKLTPGEQVPVLIILSEETTNDRRPNIVSLLFSQYIAYDINRRKLWFEDWEGNLSFLQFIYNGP